VGLHTHAARLLGAAVPGTAGESQTERRDGVITPLRIPRLQSSLSFRKAAILTEVLRGFRQSLQTETGISHWGGGCCQRPAGHM
jgi:hypothetical protein